MSEKISVIEFLAETKDDVTSPTTSTFTSKMTLCRATIAALEESLDADRSALKKMKSSIKAMYSSGQEHVKNQSSYFENLEVLGSNALYDKREPEPDIGSAFFKMSVFTKELSALLKNAMSSVNKHLLFPMESLLKNDLKGLKGDMKRPFDKSWKEYDGKVKQVEREKRQLAKEAGMIRTEITGAEIAEEMKKERRMFQLQMCEYLIKANEVKTKKGVDFLQHLVEFYHDQNSFFSEGIKVIEQYRAWSENLTANLHSIRQAQDEEKRQLVELRTVLKSVCEADNNTGKAQANVYNLHQLQGNKALGTEKSGYLMKRSEGLRKAWQKRRCFVTDGILTISHNKANKDPVRLNLLTCQLKLVPEDKKQFDLVSHNRTYRFMAEDEHDAMNWVSVLTNSKEDALNRVFGDSSSGKSGTEQSTGMKELTLSIIDEVRRLPGNNTCCDCDATDPTWLSTNLGVLLCIECSGIHRDMGVHVSRIQSLTLDDLGTSELLLAYSIGNDAFNNIMEEKLNSSLKPTSASDMEARKSFIRGKYISRNYVVQTCVGDPDALADELGQAIRSFDLAALLQLFGENADLTAPLPDYDDGETALHVAVSTPTDEDLDSILPLVDFLCQNVGQGLNKKTNTGNTALHLCAENNKTESMKLLLRSKAKTDIENANGETALAIARRLKFTACEELLEQANSGKFRPIVHIDIVWNLTCTDDDEFPSDDDLDDRTFSGPQTLFTSPAKLSTPDSTRYRGSSFKDRSKPAPDPPHVPSRNPPAVPPHQNLNRSRAQSTLPSPSVAEHYRRDSRGGAIMPPAVPSKPESMMRDRSVTSASNKMKENEDSKKNAPPEPPPKGAALSYPHKSSVASTGRLRQNDLVKPSNPSDLPKPAVRKSLKTNVTYNRSDSDSSDFVSPRRISTARPSFATRHNLPTRQNTFPSPTSTFSSILHKPRESNVTPDAKFKNSAETFKSGSLTPRQQEKFNQDNCDTPTERLKADPFSFQRSKPTSERRKTMNIEFTSWPPVPDQFDANPAQKETTFRSFGIPRPASSCVVNKFSSVPSNTVTSSTNQPTPVLDEKSRSLPRNASLLNDIATPAIASLSIAQPQSRPSSTSTSRPRRVQAMYDCDADNQDELTFVENEIIIVTGEEDPEWWVGHVEHQPHRTGVFPVSFVQFLPG